jgi:hypothetical protein
LVTDRRPEVRSVPPAACEPPEGDEPDQGDDQPEPEAPHDHHDDPDDHEDPAEGYAPNPATTFRCSHAFLLQVNFAAAGYFSNRRRPPARQRRSRLAATPAARPLRGPSRPSRTRASVPPSRPRSRKPQRARGRRKRLSLSRAGGPGPGCGYRSPGLVDAQLEIGRKHVPSHPTQSVVSPVRPLDLGSQHDDLDIRVMLGQERLDVFRIEGLVHPSHDFHLLLRHRPRSIPAYGRTAGARQCVSPGCSRLEPPCSLLARRLCEVGHTQDHRSTRAPCVLVALRRRSAAYRGLDESSSAGACSFSAARRTRGRSRRELRGPEDRRVGRCARRRKTAKG